MKIQTTKKGVPFGSSLVARSSKLAAQSSKLIALSSLLIGSAVSAEEMAKAEDFQNAKAERPIIIKKFPWIQKLDDEGKMKKAWEPNYDTAKGEVTTKARIVSYAGKWTRHNFGGHGAGPCGFRNTYNDQFGAPAGLKKIDYLDFFAFKRDWDEDGDGKTDDDFIAYKPFSLEVPFGIAPWPQSNTFPERISARFYGGTTHYLANSDTTKKANFSLEEGINADHSPPFRDTNAEDHPINGTRHKKNPGSYIRHYFTAVWKKADFLNDGNEFKVSFDDTSKLTSLMTRGYWYGWNDYRFIVQNDGQLYISEIEKNIPDYAFKNANKLNKPSGFLPVCYPTKAKWAKYYPKGYKTDFDDKGKEFKTIKFDNVEAVGFYLAKTDKSTAQTHCKWYGFECDAVITRPAKGSSAIDMVDIKSKQNPDFSITTYEIPYYLWKNIWKWGNSPSHISEARYLYKKSGSMGSMTYGENEHSQNEPVTDLTFYDALAAANTMSEMEQKTPCYYTDPEFTTVFRNQHISTLYHKAATFMTRNKENLKRYIIPTPNIYVKWDANGFRLPTVSEWTEAAGKGTAKSDVIDSTVPVEESAKNANGIYGMNGNVWEFVWNFGDVYDITKDAPVTALGGDFSGKRGEQNSPTVYGFKPYNGSGNIGLRFVVRSAGLKAPTMGEISGKTQSFSFKQQDVVGKTEETTPPAEDFVEVVKLPAGTFIRADKNEIKVDGYYMAKYATTYSKWKKVKLWAEANGYSFTKNGDMGSMYYFNHKHSPKEPVTNIPFYDAIVWCNALSEFEGRTPVYYADPSYTKILKSSPANMALKVDAIEYLRIKEKQIKILGYISEPAVWIHVKYDVDGYRIPVAFEYDYALRGGDEKIPYHENNATLQSSDDYVWHALNSKGRTHKVGMKKPNPYGLYDMQGNIFEMCGSKLMGKAKRKNRPFGLDRDNPVNSIWDGWLSDGKNGGGHQHIGLVSGPSFLHGRLYINGDHGIGVQSSPHTNTEQYFADLGFRVVRCDEGAYPTDGLRPLSPKEYERVIKIDRSNFGTWNK